MWFRLGQLLSVIVCVYLAGGHWAVLQTAAWTGMLADYSREYGVRKAVEMTFDGDHPCPMCLKIATARKSESSPNPPGGNLEKITKPDPAVAAGKHLALPAPDFSLIGLQILRLTGNSRREAPPQPPPRIAAA